MKEMLFTEILVAYLAIVNIVSFYLMGADKRKAIKKQFRIPEKTLFLWAIAGGSVGSILGMRTYRHKTRHVKFKYGMPMILVIQASLFVNYLYPYL